MSQKGCDKIQAMQQEEPSLALRIADALEGMIGEPVEFFTVFFMRDDKGLVLVSTAAMLDEDIMKQAPLLVIQSMAQLVKGEGFAHIRPKDDTKH